MLRSLLSHTVTEVDVEEVEAIDHKVYFLDSREKNEFNVSHIKDAIWVGYDDFDIERVKNIPKDEPIVVYCSVGYRSEKVSEKLIAAGYTNVSNLYGGIFEWVNQEQPVFNESGETQNVHPYDFKWGVWLKKGNKVME